MSRFDVCFFNSRFSSRLYLQQIFFLKRYMPLHPPNKYKPIGNSGLLKKKDLWTSEPGSMGTKPSSHPQHNQSPRVNLPHFHILVSFETHATMCCFYFFTTPLALPLLCSPSDVGQDAVDEQSHDGGAEQARHRHRDEPGQEDVPEEAPVHGFLRADPTHGHD